MVIQQIEKVFHENAIDATIHRDIIIPPGTSRKADLAPDLGALYFEPALILTKPLPVQTDTFQVYHADDEINTMIQIIKRLFYRTGSRMDIRPTLGRP